VQCRIVYRSSRLNQRINSPRTGFSWLSIGISRWALVNTVPSDYIEYTRQEISVPAASQEGLSSVDLISQTMSNFSFLHRYFLLPVWYFPAKWDFCIRREWKINSSFILMLYILLYHEIFYTACSTANQILFFCSSWIFCCKFSFTQSTFYGYFNAKLQYIFIYSIRTTYLAHQIKAPIRPSFLPGQLSFSVTSLKLLAKFNWDTRSNDFSIHWKECFFISIQLIMCPGKMSAECTVPIQQCSSPYCVVNKIVHGELLQYCLPFGLPQETSASSHGSVVAGRENSHQRCRLFIILIDFDWLR
jgi:hypothetical protein